MLPARTLHVIPPPLSRLADHVNAHARPLVQAVFYCAGVLHASDSVRAALATGHVVTDRYVNSVLVNHAAVNDVDERVAAALLEPWRDYLAVPDVTVYLDIAEDELLRRMTTRPDLSDSDRMLLKDRRLLRRVLRAYREHAVTDPTGCRLDVDGRKPEDLARSIAALAGVRCAD
jgi:Thymidylate kinase